jgi:branched-chain amino acid transport system substrate-binding protein
MIGSHRRRYMVAASTVVVASLALATLPAQGAVLRSETGVSKTEIVLGTTVPMSGPASPGYNKVAPAMRAYFDYVNANGGIYGRNITLKIEDDKYLPAETVKRTRKLILQDKVFATIGSLGTGTHKTVIKDLNRRGIPDLFPSTGFSGFNAPKTYPTTFTFLPSYIVESKIIGDYIKKNFAGKKVGIITQADDFGRDALEGFKIAGITFAETQKYASGTQSGGLISQVGAMDRAGVDVVVMFGVSSAAGIALATAARSGYRAKSTWIVASVGSDATTLGILGIPAGVLNGVISASFAPAPTDDSDEYIAFFKKVNADYNKGAAWDNNVLVGMNQAFLATQAIAAAGPKLTRKGLINAMETKGKTFAHASLVPLAYSKTNHSGPSGYWFGTFNASGELKPNGGRYTVFTTDSRNGPVSTTTYNRPKLPAKGLPAKR